MAEAAAPFRLLAAFADGNDRDGAAAELRHSGFVALESFSPMPDGEEFSWTPRVTLAAGLIGLAGGFFMQVYANTLGYPLDIGGRPEVSWPSFGPIAFEIGMGLAVIIALVTAFVSVGLLKLHDRRDEAELMRRATSDRWLLAIDAFDPDGLRRARGICAASGAKEIEEARLWASEQ